MSVKLLDPTLDVVFKLLLLRDQSLLRDMIESVLGRRFPIAELEVQNPEIPEDAPGDKSVVLDIRVRLSDGGLIDLEMQSTTPPGTAERFIYYWARNFVDTIVRGDDYTLLRPCISILWFKVPFLKALRFHSTFVAADLESREVLSPVFELHVLELSKLQLATADRQAKLERWARFLRATTVEELQQLAHEDPIMNTAKKVLEDLSLDPEARRIARDRETAVLMHRHLMAASREEGRAEGRAEGIAEGEAKGLVEGEVRGLVSAIRSLCSVLGIALDDDKERQLARLNRDRLLEVVRTLETERRWPADE